MGPRPLAATPHFCRLAWHGGPAPEMARAVTRRTEASKQCCYKAGVRRIKIHDTRGICGSLQGDSNA